MERQPALGHHEGGIEILHNCVLAETNFSHRKWKKIFIIVEVIGFVLCMISLGICILGFIGVATSDIKRSKGSEPTADEVAIAILVAYTLCAIGEAICCGIALLGVGTKSPALLWIFLFFKICDIIGWIYIFIGAPKWHHKATAAFYAIFTLPEVFLAYTNVKALRACPRCY
ncbi:unnamed protein product, partial [Mesorhabditis spiculigera]